MKLYSYWRSSAAYRVRIALAVKKLDFETVSIDLTAGAQRDSSYAAINPAGLVPALEHSGQLLTQSLAIIEYLDSLATPTLLPAAAIDRARVNAAAQTVACDIHPLNNLRVLNFLRGEFEQAEPQIGSWYRHWVREGFQTLEAFAREHGGNFLYGDRITLADVCFLPQLYNAERFKCDLIPYPMLRSLGERLRADPLIASARPEAQPDALP